MINLTSYCVIRNGKALLNDEEIFSGSKNYDEFIKDLYRHLKIGYPKFFKMDRSSKLALVASELLLSGRELIKEYKSDKIGVYLANNASSLDTDREHQKSIADSNNYFPSPAVFVYTLPNIMVGEISIKQKIKGPNDFFIFDNFEAQFFGELIHDQMTLNKIDVGLFGWVNVDGEDYEAVLYLAEKKRGDSPLNSLIIDRIFYK